MDDVSSDYVLSSLKNRKMNFKSIVWFIKAIYIYFFFVFVLFFVFVFVFFCGDKVWITLD